MDIWTVCRGPFSDSLCFFYHLVLFHVTGVLLPPGVSHMVMTWDLGTTPLHHFTAAATSCGPIMMSLYCMAVKEWFISSFQHAS